MKKIIVATAFSAVLCCLAGPLGISQGMTLKELQKQGPFLPTADPVMYQSAKVIKGHPDFNEYAVFLTPKQGVCKIIASSRNIATSEDGEEILKSYETTAAALKNKYGEPQSFDNLKPETIWTRPRDLMMALVKHDRTIRKYWIADKKHVFPDSLHAVILSISALSTDEAYLLLVYEFKNFETCQQEVKASKAKDEENL